MGERRGDLGVGVAQQHEDADSGDLRFDGRLVVGDDGEETTRDGGEFRLEAAIGDPKAGDRRGGGSDFRILARKQGTESLTAFLQLGGRGDAPRGDFAQDDGGELRVRGSRGGTKHAHRSVGRKRGGEGDGEIRPDRSLAREHHLKGGGGIGRSGGGRRGGFVVVRPGGQEERTRLSVKFGRTKGTDGGETDASVLVGDTGLERGDRQGETCGFGHQEGVLPDRGRTIRGGSDDQSGFQAFETLQGPEGQDAGLRDGVGAHQGVERTGGRGLQAGITIHQGAERVEADDLVRMAERGDESGDIGLGKVRNDELGRRLVLDAIDASEIVLSVRTDRGARLAVQRTTGVVVRHDRSVEVEDVQGAVRTEAHVDRTEPMVHRA